MIGAVFRIEQAQSQQRNRGVRKTPEREPCRCSEQHRVSTAELQNERSLNVIMPQAAVSCCVAGEQVFHLLHLRPQHCFGAEKAQEPSQVSICVALHRSHVEEQSAVPRPFLGLMIIFVDWPTVILRVVWIRKWNKCILLQIQNGEKPAAGPPISSGYISLQMKVSRPWVPYNCLLGVKGYCCYSSLEISRQGGKIQIEQTTEQTEILYHGGRWRRLGRPSGRPTICLRPNLNAKLQ